MKVLAPSLLMGSPSISETLPHPRNPSSSTYVADIQEKFENGDAIVLRYLVGQDLWDALKNFNKFNMAENGVKKVSCSWYSMTGRSG